MYSTSKNLILNVKPIQKIFLRTKKLKIGIIGVPFSRGQIKSGVEKAPDALRQAGLMRVINQMGIDVKDYGDVCYNEKEAPSEGEIHSNMEWLPQVAVCSEKVSLKAEEIIVKERILLTLGGDHSVALGSVDGHIKAKMGNVCIIWVDAHPDLNTADTSPSGNLHGMTAALLVKEMSHFWPYLPGLDWQKPMMSVSRLAYIGLRSIDSDERVIIEKFGVTAFGMSEIEKVGIHRVTKEAIRRINPEGDCSIHLSFDIDALDPLEAPSTGTPVRGGLSLREALILVETIQRTGRLAAVDLVEINPHIGTEYQVKLTLEAAMHIVKAAFAHSRSAHKIKHKIYPEASNTPLEVDVDFTKFDFLSPTEDTTKYNAVLSHDVIKQADKTQRTNKNDPKVSVASTNIIDEEIQIKKDKALSSIDKPKDLKFHEQQLTTVTKTRVIPLVKQDSPKQDNLSDRKDSKKATSDNITRTIVVGTSLSKSDSSGKEVDKKNKIPVSKIKPSDKK